MQKAILRRIRYYLTNGSCYNATFLKDVHNAPTVVAVPGFGPSPGPRAGAGDVLNCDVVVSGGVAQEHVPGVAARGDRVPGCAALAGQERSEPLAEVPTGAVRGLLAGFHGVTAGTIPATEVSPITFAVSRSVTAAVVRYAARGVSSA